MIKKITILTLILSLITTQSYGIIPESVSKSINFFQDTRKSFFQRVMEYFQEKIGLSHAEEYNTKTPLPPVNLFDYKKNDAKENKEDYFIEYNMKFVNQQKQRVMKFFKNKPSKIKKEICSEIIKREKFNRWPQEELDFLWNFLKNPEKHLRTEYQKVAQMINEERKKDAEGKVKLSHERKEYLLKLEALLNSDKPDFMQLTGGHDSEKFWHGYNMIKYCKECGYMNDKNFKK